MEVQHEVFFFVLLYTPLAFYDICRYIGGRSGRTLMRITMTGMLVV